MDAKRKSKAAKNKVLKAANKKNSLFLEDYVLKEPVRRIITRRRSVFPLSSDDEDLTSSPPLFEECDEFRSSQPEVCLNNKDLDKDRLVATMEDRFPDERAPNAKSGKGEVSRIHSQNDEQLEDELEDLFGPPTKSCKGMANENWPASSGYESEKTIRPRPVHFQRRKDELEDSRTPAASSGATSEETIRPRPVHFQNREYYGDELEDLDAPAASSGTRSEKTIRPRPVQRREDDELEDSRAPAASSGTGSEKTIRPRPVHFQRRKDELEDSRAPAASRGATSEKTIRPRPVHFQSREEELEDSRAPSAGCSRGKENRIRSPPQGATGISRKRPMVQESLPSTYDQVDTSKHPGPTKPTSAKPRQSRQKYAPDSRLGTVRNAAELAGGILSSSDDDESASGKRECSSCAWKHRHTSLTIKYNMLKKQKFSTEVERNRLSNSLTSKMMDKCLAFESTDGFPSSDHIKAIHDSTTSDKTFTRLLMKEIWGTGFGNCTVTGRKTTNANGRPSASALERQLTAREVDGALDQDKVKFVRDRLFERFLLRGVDPTTAAFTARKDGSLYLSQIICQYNRKGKW